MKRFAYFTLIERHHNTGPFREHEWTAKVEVLGQHYTVALFHGSQRVRIAYSSKRGWKWYASVRDNNGEVWSAEVRRSTGLGWILEAAGLIPRREEDVARIKDNIEYERKEVDYWRVEVTSRNTYAVRDILGDHEERLKGSEAALAYDNELRERFTAVQEGHRHGQGTVS